jgi:hypothetical protein
MTEDPWLMRIEGGLSAHFKQEGAPSRPGTMWTVGIKRGDETYRAMVKAMLSDDATAATRGDETYQAQTAMEYLNDLIASGWHPSQQREHTITIGNPTAQATSIERRSRPWWRF